MGSLVMGLLALIFIALFGLGAARLMEDLKEGERDGIINLGYVGENDDADKDDI